MNKLRVIVRGDLVHAQQAVQAMHAAIEYVLDYGIDRGISVALLVVPSEDALMVLASKARERDILVSEFREPDMGEALTAIAIEPCSAARNLCAGLPLLVPVAQRQGGVL